MAHESHVLCVADGRRTLAILVNGVYGPWLFLRVDPFQPAPYRTHCISRIRIISSLGVLLGLEPVGREEVDRASETTRETVNVHSIRL